jgi:hypothetical protein
MAADTGVEMLSQAVPADSQTSPTTRQTFLMYSSLVVNYSHRLIMLLLRFWTRDACLDVE